MKNKLLGIAIFITVIGFIWLGCTGNAQPAPNVKATEEGTHGGKTLDEAIAEAAVRIDERIEAGTKIATLNFNSPSDRFSSYVLDELTANLLDSRKLIVVDRKEIDLIRSEIDFQYSGEVADESMQAVGRRLGAQSIVSGSLTDIGGDFRIVIRVLNVQTAPANGTYTFLPRLRGYVGAAPIDAYLYQIVVRGDYMAVYISSTVTGWRAVGSRVFKDGGSPQNVRLRDLDNQGQTYYPEPGIQTTHSWDNNGEWFTFKGVKGRRFSLTISHESPPVVWDEIKLNTPN